MSRPSNVIVLSLLVLPPIVISFFATCLYSYFSLPSASDSFSYVNKPKLNVPVGFASTSPLTSKVFVTMILFLSPSMFVIETCCEVASSNVSPVLFSYFIVNSCSTVGSVVEVGLFSYTSCLKEPFVYLFPFLSHSNT